MRDISSKALSQYKGLPDLDMDRVKSGIPSFDEISNGGFIQERSYLLLGAAGTGKTIFAMQFLYNGAELFKENGVYLTSEEPPEQLRRDVSSFNWDVGSLEDEKRIAILDATSAKIGLMQDERYKVPRPATLDGVLYEIYKAIETTSAKRVVVDSLDSLEVHVSSQDDYRSFMLKLVAILKSFHTTSIIISEAPGEGRNARRGIEEFVTDGIILLTNELVDAGRQRKIEIIKMRGSAHRAGQVPFIIGREGIEIQATTELGRLVRKMTPKEKANAGS